MAARSNSTSASPNKSTDDADPNAPASLRAGFNTMQSDIYRARCMADILCEKLDQALDGGITRADDPDWCLIDRPTRDLIYFGSDNVLERLMDMETQFEALFQRFIDEHDPATEARADAAWRATEQAATGEASKIPDGNLEAAGIDVDDPLGDLECALSAIEGFSDAVYDLSTGTDHVERRLSGIRAVSAGLVDETKLAMEAVRALYARRAAPPRSRAAA